MAGKPSIWDSSLSPRPKSGSGVIMTSYSLAYAQPFLLMLFLSIPVFAADFDWKDSALFIRPALNATSKNRSICWTGGSCALQGGATSKMSNVPVDVMVTRRGGPPKFSWGHHNMALTDSLGVEMIVSGNEIGGNDSGAGTRLQSVNCSAAPLTGLQI